jgi:ABC-2 type transport system permease protein
MTTLRTRPEVAGEERLAAVPHRARFGSVLLWELRKLRAQYRTRALLLGAVLAPVPVVAVIHGQSRPPKDTLFGRYAIDDGFSMALLVLGFALQWVLPLMTAIVAGDIFASEDQHGTWKTVLTRSTSRGQIFWAKTAAAAAFAVVVVALLATSTIVASLVLVGREPLIGLSGQTISAHEALRLVSASWATTLAPVLGFTSLAILLSVWSRNPAVGIAAPVVLGMVMQLVGALGGIDSLRPFLLTTPFEAWHGLLTEPRFTGPLTQGLMVSAGWTVVSLSLAFVLFRRRDITGD